MIAQNQETIDKKIREFATDGKEKLHVITDFDRTMTSPLVKGIKIPSVISILRDKDYLSSEYSIEATTLAKHYGAIERSPNISEQEKKKAMQEWWEKHFELLQRSGLNREHLKRIVNEGGIVFREGVFNFLDYLNQQNIPLVILSSNDVGDTIEMLLKKEKRLYSNIYVITNRFEYNEKDESVIGVQRPIIHVMNKDETSVRNFPSIYKAIKNRKNVLLLGDSLGDLGMVNGFDYHNLLSIGFLEEEDLNKKQRYLDSFDGVLENNASFREINKILMEIVEK